MKIIFMGTPDYAAAALDSLIKAGHEIVLVVTMPDKPAGRGGKIRLSPVKELALKEGLKIFQPEKVKSPDAVSVLKEAGADIGVVAAFGQILSSEALAAPRLGCVNIHASLLPRYRGASPIQQAILDGVPTTGVTIMQMDEGIDTGDIICQRQIPVEKDETGGSLFEKLTSLGADLITDALKTIEKGEARPFRQNAELATYTGQIRKDMGVIRWGDDAEYIERLVRAMDPWPSAYTRLPDQKLMKIWKAQAESDDANSRSEIGKVCAVDRTSFAVSTGKGLLRVLEVQLEGKKRMSAADFLRGYRIPEGTILY